MKKILSIFTIALFTIPSFAQKMNLEQAKEVAYRFMNQTGFHTKGLVKKGLVNNVPNSIKDLVETDNNSAPFYVITDSLEPSTFVIIAGDSRMKSVLAYGHNGRWEEENIPDGLLFLLENYRNQYEMLQGTGLSKRNTTTNIEIPDVEPMLNTKWRQETPYNNLCPNNCPSGCVATAMSQVMKFHQFPHSGMGSFSYTTHTRKYKCTYDFESAAFDWGQMKNSYSTSTFGSENTDPIAQISYACGVSVGMDYDKSGSGAYMSDVPYALIHFFGYNANVSFRDRKCYDAEEWYQMLCNELASGRPVLYGGVDSKNGGHAFVIDGCSADNRKFHVNWGWGGSFNDYYELDALDPQTYRFSSYQDMVINISPELVGTFQDVFYADKFSVSSKIELNKSVTFTISDVYCYSSQSSYVVSNAKFYGRIGVGIFDKDFNFLSSIDSDSIEGLNNFYGFSKITYSTKITKSQFPEDGTYYIAPYVKETNSEIPTRIRTTGGETDYILVLIDGEDLDTKGEKEEPIEVVSEWNEDFEARAIPNSWNQEIELGISEWKSRYVLMSSESLPPAAHGKGYVYLDYATGLDLYNSRTVARLITSTISLTPENKYNLSFQYRKYATQPESTDILTIYYKETNEWIPLTEVAISNQGEWRKATIELPDLENVKLAFEGSPSKGASIMLDDIRIYKRGDEINGIDKLKSSETSDESCKVYTLSGILVAQTKKSRVGTIGLSNGTYILRTSKSVFKIHIK